MAYAQQSQSNMRRSVREIEQQIQITCLQATGPFVQQCHATCAAASENKHSSVYARVHQSVLVRRVVMAVIQLRQGTYATFSGHMRISDGTLAN
jgi:hypothetical protein